MCHHAKKNPHSPPSDAAYKEVKEYFNHEDEINPLRYCSRPTIWKLCEEKERERGKEYLENNKKAFNE